jgi:hypothetical protein
MKCPINAWLLPFTLVVAISFVSASGQRINGGANPSPTITSAEASNLINLLPVVEELRAKGMDVSSDLRAVPDMYNTGYYFFWVYNKTAQKQGEIASISVGNYAVNKRTADVRVWSVSEEVFHGDNGALITSKELDRMQAELRTKHGIDSASIQQYRSGHLAAKIIPRDAAQSAVRLPITEQLSDTAELSCWRDSQHFISRQGRSSIFSSSAGSRAYAEVNAVAFKPKYQETYTGPLCENSVRLFLAKDGASDFQVLFDSTKPKNDCVTIAGEAWCAVKGIRLVDWSKDGRFLLAELLAWEYESDSGITRVPIVYNTSTGEFIRPDVYHFFDQYYWTDASKKNCEFDLTTKGLSPGGDLVLTATRPTPNSTYDQIFCFNAKQTFEFQLRTNKITRLPDTYKEQRYGIWQSGDIH